MARVRVFVGRCTCAIACVAAIHSGARAQGVSIDHKPVGCVVAGRFPLLEARFDPAEAVGRARVLFRAAGTPSWYFVEMRREKGVFLGTLPRPLKATTRIEYYVEVVDRSLEERRTPDYAPAVVGAASECKPGMLPAAMLASAKIALGSLAPGAAALPAGFSSVGIVGGSLAGTAAGAGGAAGGGGLSTGAVLGIVGAGAAVAGGVALAAKGGSSPSTAPPATTPAAPTTTTPAGPNLTGGWVGELIVTQNLDCDAELDFVVDLAQTGSSVSGSGTVVTRRSNPARPNCRGSSAVSIVGTVGQSTVDLTASGTNDGFQFGIRLTGSVTGNRMTGSFQCTPSTCNQAGTWALNRQ